MRTRSAQQKEAASPSSSLLDPSRSLIGSSDSLIRKSSSSATSASVPISKQRRRKSVFESPNSPWARRRSLLSDTMLSHEEHSVYECYSREPGVLSFTMSLREAQGFSWNQDLFTSRYQRSLSGCLDEKSHAPKVHDIIIYDSDEDIFPVDN